MYFDKSWTRGIQRVLSLALGSIVMEEKKSAARTHLPPPEWTTLGADQLCAMLVAAGYDATVKDGAVRVPPSVSGGKAVRGLVAAIAAIYQT